MNIFCKIGLHKWRFFKIKQIYKCKKCGKIAKKLVTKEKPQNLWNDTF
jgi:hypothetical protein